MNETIHDIYVRGHIQESLIHKPWKMIRNRHKDGSPASYQLYNIESDPEEKHNVIDNICCSNFFSYWIL